MVISNASIFNFQLTRFIWVFPKIGVPQNGWFVMENPIKVDDLGGTTIFGNTHISITNTLFFGQLGQSIYATGIAAAAFHHYRNGINALVDQTYDTNH